MLTNSIFLNFHGNCQTPVLDLGLGVDFTFAWDNNSNDNNDNTNNPHVSLLTGTVLAVLAVQAVGIRDRIKDKG